MISASATGVRRPTDEREPEPLPTMFTMLVGTYWPPGLPKFPVNSHSSFSR